MTFGGEWLEDLNQSCEVWFQIVAVAILCGVWIFFPSFCIAFVFLPPTLQKNAYISGRLNSTLSVGVNMHVNGCFSICAMRPFRGVV